MQRLFNLPLQLQVGAFVAAGIAIVFALFSILGWSMLRQSVQRVADERLVIAQLAASFLDTEIEEQFEQLERAAQAAGATLENRSEQSAIPSALRHAEPFVEGVFLVDERGSLRWSDISDTALLDNETALALGSGKLFADASRYVSGVHATGQTSRPFAVIAVPALGSGDVPLGALGALLDVSHPTFRDAVETSTLLGKTGHAEIVDQHGRVLASSEPHRVLQPGEHPDFYLPLLAQRTYGTAITAPIGEEDTAERGLRHAMVFAPFKAVPWGLSLGGSEGELFLEADQWRTQMALFGGLGLLVALGLVWIATRSVATSVCSLTQASQRMGAGDLTTPVPDLGQGEVRTLAEALDEMRCHLQEALDALAVEKSRYQSIVGSMADAVFTTDSHLQITAFNPAAEVLTGCRSDDAVGRHCREVFGALETCDSGVCVARCGSDASRDYHPYDSTTKEFVKQADSHAVPVSHTRSPVMGADGTVVGVVHVLRDLSADAELERLKDEFLSMVSHELRTPLGFVKGYATSLLLPDGQPDKDTVDRCLRVIVEASDELEELVDNLLDMSSIGAGSFSTDPRPIPLAPLVQAAIRRARLRYVGRHLRSGLSPHLPAVLADRQRIEQVLFNLLDNALKYSPNNGQVVIGATSAGSEVVVTVSDQGIGIPPDEIQRVFDPFQRGSGVRARRIGGSGLGLSICRGIVEAHGGRIWVESPEPGHAGTASPGTLVTFTLPASEERQRPEPRLSPCGDPVDVLSRA